MENRDILGRIDELLKLGPPNSNSTAPELSQGCVSLLSLVYGPKSVQVERFNISLADIARKQNGPGFTSQQIAVTSHGALRNLKREIDETIAHLQAR